VKGNKELEGEKERIRRRRGCVTKEVEHLRYL